MATTKPMPRCPYGKKGRHELSVIIPETTELPATLFCDACGSTRQVSLTNLPAMDDLPADAIARMARR